MSILDLFSYSTLLNIKIIMRACRYWPENEEAQSEVAGISLEALHQLASQRAEARRKSEYKVALSGISEILIAGVYY